jgi:hypothetical protein
MNSTDWEARLAQAGTESEIMAVLEAMQQDGLSQSEALVSCVRYGRVIGSQLVALGATMDFFLRPMWWARPGVSETAIETMVLTAMRQRDWKMVRDVLWWRARTGMGWTGNYMHVPGQILDTLWQHDVARVLALGTLTPPVEMAVSALVLGREFGQPDTGAMIRCFLKHPLTGLAQVRDLWAAGPEDLIIYEAWKNYLTAPADSWWRSDATAGWMIELYLTEGEDGFYGLPLGATAVLGHADGSWHQRASELVLRWWRHGDQSLLRPILCGVAQHIQHQGGRVALWPKELVVALLNSPQKEERLAIIGALGTPTG